MFVHGNHSNVQRPESLMPLFSEFEGITKQSKLMYHDKRVCSLFMQKKITNSRQFNHQLRQELAISTDDLDLKKQFLMPAKNFPLGQIIITNNDSH
ncbi:CLUMA_CG014739, isoform A [Clunio marinus]|uniref:CLUMA_CG014739, isoform A n=1 Tax=Clunio marinus TaxID=568069 RepID=A0A1J1INT5_9DIPT|nr:CLUMA_CG014739, isoform A [Clunio marinus]